jgi:hypothetical protein
MELDPKDYDVVRLLTKLKDNNGVYPPELMTPRRQTYIQRVAEIGLGFGVSSALKNTVKSGSNAGTYSTIAGGLLEAALVVAIVAEAGAAAYIYRDQITALFQSYTSQPRVEEVSSVPATDFSPILPELILSNPTEAATTPLTDVTPVTPSGTPVPGAAASAAPSAGANNNDQNGPGIQGNSTPDPKGNNGNQYGLTPKPERTKEPGGNNNNDNNDKGKDKDK